MTAVVSGEIQYVRADGTLTYEGIALFQELAADLTALQAKLAAIAAVTPPAGGGTVDSQARTAVSAIITAAG